MGRLGRPHVKLAATVAVVLALAFIRMGASEPASIEAADGRDLSGQYASMVPASTAPGAAVYNLKVVSDASPDLSDLNSFVHSTTSRFSTAAEKVWALFYWSHILKRQTSPMVLHGFEVTDPIRNFSDYGYTMCSTVSGINQSLYETLGLPHQYWDLCNHTVSAVEYDNSFHMVDSSMSNLVTTDDGVTLASVQDAAADSARLVRERSLYSTSANGFLTGSDLMRNLVDTPSPVDGSIVAGFANNFCAAGLKLRDYYYNWDSGHRYVLNLREDESYTRYYRRLGTTPDYWVGSEHLSSPDPAQTFEIDAADKFGVRGNGQWTFAPKLSADAWERAAYRAGNITASGGGLRPEVPDSDAELVYKVQGANAITSQSIQAQFSRSDPLATAALAVSLNSGATWTAVASVGSEVGDAVMVSVKLRDEVSGAYETLVRVQMRTRNGTPDGIVLTALTIDTLTQVNVKALPKLTAGRNEIVVDAGDQSDTMVLWPDLRGGLWRRDAYDSQNIATQSVSVPKKFSAVAYPSVLLQDAYLTYRMDAPTDITRLVYGGRLHNFRAGSYIDFLHSFDGGASWVHTYRLSDVSAPYDVIHFETVAAIPAGVKTVLFKYLIHNTETSGSRPSGLYSIRMEVNHRPVTPTPAPVDVTLRWREVRADRTLVDRGHRQRVSEFPFTYVVNVGGSDHPVMDSIKLTVADGSDAAPFGYTDGIDAGGQKYVYMKRTDGTNVAKNKPYSFSRPPSGFQSSAPASNTSILTDGVVGSPQSGGASYWWTQCWSANQEVSLQIDMGQPRTVGAFRAHLLGSPSWDALLGQVQDMVEIQTSLDGVNFGSQGVLQMALWKKDIPANHMLLDTEKATAWNFERRLPAPVSARYVRYRVTPRRILCASELQVFDRVDYEPFDMRIALPEHSAEPPPPPPPPPPTPPVVDEIVLHAAVQPLIADGWQVTSDGTAASGVRLQNPNANAPKLAAPLANPAQFFELTFNADGGKGYRLWLRGKALNDSYTNDSVYVQFGGSVDETGNAVWRVGTTSATTVVLEDCSGCNVQGWGWADNAYGLNALGPLVYFAASGTQRIRIQVREDGLAIDQIVLSAGTYRTTPPGATKNDSTILPATR
jgi:hypothetical protein